MWQYFNLKFPDKATADTLLEQQLNVDNVGNIDGVTGWHVNLALEEGVSIPISLEPYVIPFPLNPKRVWFVEHEGGVL